MYRRGLKRVIDMLLSLTALTVLSPLFLLLWLLIHLRLGAPALFKQQRPGLHGKPFTIYKFRTMTDARGTNGNLLPDAMRLTLFGRFLRSTSIDELPELLNVLKGEMSLVGPRPLLMQYIDRYTPEQMRRHEVKPGITGWAQINGRNAITWEEKFALDVWYVDHCSLWLDLKIIALTLWKVLKREGISQQGQATMAEFTGTQTPSYDKRVILFLGAGGHGKVIADMLLRQGIKVLGFLDDNPSLIGQQDSRSAGAGSNYTVAGFSPGWTSPRDRRQCGSTEARPTIRSRRQTPLDNRCSSSGCSGEFNSGWCRNGCHGRGSR